MQNYVQDGCHINVACDDPATPASGDPVRIGEFCGVAITAVGEGDNASGETTVLTEGVVNLLVAGVDSSGIAGADANVAVAVGDKVYYGDGDTPKLSKRDGGTLFGYALGPVDSGDTTTTIPVMLRN
jgi:predicted RecA/RadA family phage recombinase